MNYLCTQGQLNASMFVPHAIPVVRLSHRCQGKEENQVYALIMATNRRRRRLNGNGHVSIIQYPHNSVSNHSRQVQRHWLPQMANQ